MVISGVVVMLAVLANPICQYRLWGKMKNFLSLTVTKVFMVQKYQTLNEDNIEWGGTIGTNQTPSQENSLNSMFFLA